MLDANFVRCCHYKILTKNPLFQITAARIKMNSGELKVDVPLASIESDCEDPGDGNSAMNTPSKRDNKLTANKPKPKLSSLNIEGGDSVTGSLEDLVNSFDEKLTMCFQDYQEQVDKIAPVQVRIILSKFLLFISKFCKFLEPKYYVNHVAYLKSYFMNVQTTANSFL